MLGVFVLEGNHSSLLQCLPPWVTDEVMSRSLAYLGKNTPRELLWKPRSLLRAYAYDSLFPLFFLSFITLLSKKKNLTVLNDHRILLSPEILILADVEDGAVCEK